MTTRFRLLALALVAALCSQLTAGSAVAQTEEIDQLRAERDEARAERSRAAADLDPLIAANEQIEEALRLLSEDRAASEAALEATQAQLEKTRADIAAAELQQAQEEATILGLREQLQLHAISAYVQPRSGEDVFAGDDLNDGETRRALVEAVSTSRTEIIDNIRIAESNLELAVDRAEAAARDLALREQEVQAQILELQASEADQLRLQQILDSRITEFRSEIDAHLAFEDRLTQELTGLIVEEEARQAAIREAARIQAERERVAQEEARLAAQRAADLAAGRVPAETTVNRAEAELVNAPTVPGSLAWPVSGTMTSGFGPRWGRQHNGIDVAASIGTPVTAAGSGSVVNAGPNGGFGNMVTINHGNGLVTVYAHLNAINVRSGQTISTGQSVGTVGTTGNSTGPHLHFETRINGIAYNPLQYLG